MPIPPVRPPFIGRERELAGLRRLLAAAPVVAVVGPPGVGKTALAIAVAEALDARERGLLVSFDGSGAGDVAGLLAQAEEQGSLVILDGFEATRSDRGEVIATLARGARRSRWIVTARTLPPGPPPRLQLQPLQHDAALALALALGVAEADLDWAAEVSRGAPGRLRRLVTPDRTPPLSLPAAARPWLARLAAVSAAVPPERLAGADDDAVAAAVAAGVVTRTVAGLTLDPIVRADVRELLEPLLPEAKRAFAAALEAAPDAASWANAIELYLQLGDRERAGALLDQRGEALLDSLHVSELWETLRPVTAPELARWRFRVGVAAGVVAEVDVDDVRDDDVAIRCDRARLLGLRGKSEAAREAAEQVLAELGPGELPHIAFRAAMASAAASLNLRQGDRALEVLERTRATTETDRFSLAVVKAKALAIAGREVEGYAVLDDLRPLAMRLHPILPHPARARLAGACLDLDERPLARHLLPDPVACAHSAFGPDVTHTIDVAHACIIALDDGRLADVAPFAELQESIPLEHNLVTTHVRLIRAEWLVATGRFAAARALLADVGAVDRADNAEWLGMLGAHIDMATAQAPPTSLAPPPGGEAASTEAIARLRHGLRWGGGSIAALPSRTEEKARTRRCLPLQLRAEHHLVHGTLADAAYDAARACREAERHDYRVLLADALLTQADVACVAGDWGGCREAGARLAAVGRVIVSPRWETEAAFYPAALDRDWTHLERLAARPEPAPVAARRAAALLGDEVVCDALDRRVVAALVAREGWPAVTVLAGDGDPWGIDLAQQRAWAIGAWVALEPHKVSWRLLAALALAGGRASSRALLVAVWDVHDYRPHLHDNRLQITVHRLRAALGGGADARLVRDGDGYALAGRCRIVRPAPG